MLHRPLYRRGSGHAFIRQLNPAAWFRYNTGITVTGSGVSQWDDQSGNARHLKQGTDANRPIALLHTGTNYLYCPGVEGNYVSTPDSVANSITGDIDIRVRVALSEYTPTTINELVAKTAGGTNRSYFFQLNTNGTLRLGWSPDGTLAAQIVAASTSATGITDGSAAWVRATLDVNNGSGGYDLKFYTASDSATEPTSWTQLGNTVTGGATTSIFNGTAIVEIGTDTTGTSNPASGKIYRAIIKNGIDGTTVVDFNPEDATSNFVTSLTSSTTGEVWTINTSGAKPAQIVGKSSILFDGSAHFLKCDAFTLNQPTSWYVLGKCLSWTSQDRILSGSAVNVALFQFGSTPQIQVFAGSAVGANGGLALNTVGVMACVINGAGSLTQINLGSPVTGDAGASNPGGLVLGALNTGMDNFGHIQIYEVIAFPTAHDASQRARVIRYLAGIGGVAL